MKKLIIATLTMIALTTQPVIADKLTDEQVDRVCTSISNLARTVMTRRQQGAEMAELLRLADGNEVARGLVMDAYTHSRYQTESVRTRTIQEFGNSVHLMCLREFQ